MAGVPVTGFAERRLPARRRLVALALVTATFAVACTSKARPPTSSVSPSTPAVSDSQVKADVLEAWRAHHAAYAAALRAMDPNSADLAKTAINPLLDGARAFITLAKRRGLVARGSQDLGQPMVVELTPAGGPTTAIVEACIHGGLLLYDRSGKPVNGTAGRVTWNHERATLRLITGIGWLMSDNDVRSGPTEASCAGH